MKELLKNKRKLQNSFLKATAIFMLTKILSKSREYLDDFFSQLHKNF